jgi:sugar phosphate permease
MIDRIGWRQSFNFMGIAGMILGVATLLFVKEPERGVFSPKKESKEQDKKKDGEKKPEKFLSFRKGLFDIWR